MNLMFYYFLMIYKDFRLERFIYSHDVPHKSVMGVQYFHVIKPTPGSIKFSSLNSLKMSLNPEMVYSIGIFDPKFSMVSNNHKIIPRAYLLLDKYMGYVTIQIEVS